MSSLTPHDLQLGRGELPRALLWPVMANWVQSIARVRVLDSKGVRDALRSRVGSTVFLSELCCDDAARTAVIALARARGVRSIYTMFQLACPYGAAVFAALNEPVEPGPTVEQIQAWLPGAGLLTCMLMYRQLPRLYVHIIAPRVGEYEGAIALSMVKPEDPPPLGAPAPLDGLVGQRCNLDPEINQLLESTMLLERLNEARLGLYEVATAILESIHKQRASARYLQRHLAVLREGHLLLGSVGVRHVICVCCSYEQTRAAIGRKTIDVITTQPLWDEGALGVPLAFANLSVPLDLHHRVLIAALAFDSCFPPTALQREPLAQLVYRSVVLKKAQ